MPIWIDTLQRKSLNVSAVEIPGSGCPHSPSTTAIATAALPVTRKCGTSVAMVRLLVPPPDHWLSQVLAWLPPPVLFSSAPVHHAASSPLPSVLSCRWCSQWHSPSFSPILSSQHLTGSTGTAFLESQGGLVWIWRKCNRFVLWPICRQMTTVDACYAESNQSIQISNLNLVAKVQQNCTVTKLKTAKSTTLKINIHIFSNFAMLC